MNTTNKVSENTNNLSANIIQSGVITFIWSGDFTDTGTTIGDTPPREAYYGTKSVLLNVSKDTIPYVFAWYSVGASATSWLAMNHYGDFENPYEAWNKAWFSFTKSGSQLNLNFYILDEQNSLSNNVHVYYRVTSANATESSGL